VSAASDFTLIVAVGVDRQGSKHVLGLWSGATENSEVCGVLLDDLIERVGDLCRNVKRWRDGNMARRWAASVLLEAQSHFRRIQAYSQLPQLINAIAMRLDKKEAAA
jgi:putative transposase